MMISARLCRGNKAILLNNVVHTYYFFRDMAGQNLTHVLHVHRNRFYIVLRVLTLFQHLFKCKMYALSSDE